MSETYAFLDDLIAEHRRVVGVEREPSTYRWYVTEPVHREIYSAVSPICRVDGVDEVTYHPQGYRFYTDIGVITVCAGSNRIQRRDYSGDVVARLFDGDAVLVQYKHEGPTVNTEVADE